MSNFRIITAENKVKFAGTNTPSWMTIETAKKLVDYSKGEMIFEYNANGEKLWEVL